MKRIGIDCRFASINAGIGRYTRELVPEILKQSSGHEFVLFVRDANEDWIQLLQKPYTLHPTPYAHYSLQEQLLFPTVLRKAKIDLLFSPHFNVPYFCPVPFIAVVHDLILHHYPNQASVLRQLAYRALMKRTVQSAESIIAISSYTASDIEKQYCVQATVVDEGVSSLYTEKQDPDIQEVLAAYGVARPFFLYVGGAKEHKNVQALIDAHAAVQGDADLVLITGGKEAAALQLHDGVRVISGVSDSELSAFYSAATALLTASLFEGYCLPAVEALACNCPVIASNRTSIPEVTKGAAMLVEPTVEAFVTAMQNPPARPVMFEAPRWDAAARTVVEILRRRIEG